VSGGTAGYLRISPSISRSMIVCSLNAITNHRFTSRSPSVNAEQDASPSHPFAVLRAIAVDGAWAMAYKLIEAAQARWRAVNAPHLLPWAGPAPSSTKANSSYGPPTSRRPNPNNHPKRRLPERPHPHADEGMRRCGLSDAHVSMCLSGFGGG
jgi:hypothetical protein